MVFLIDSHYLQESYLVYITLNNADKIPSNDIDHAKVFVELGFEIVLK